MGDGNESEAEVLVCARSGDIRDTAGMLEREPGPVDPAKCEHFWKFRVKGGEPLAIGVCTFCGDINWDELRKDLEFAAVDWGSGENVNGRCTRCKLPWDSIHQMRRDTVDKMAADLLAFRTGQDGASS